MLGSYFKYKAQCSHFPDFQRNVFPWVNQATIFKSIKHFKYLKHFPQDMPKEAGKVLISIIQYIEHKIQQAKFSMSLNRK